MKRWLTLLPLAIFCIHPPAGANEKCRLEPLPAKSPSPTALIQRNNQLAAENLRLGLLTDHGLMPRVQIRNTQSSSLLIPEAQALSLQAIPVVDPFDGQQRDLGFLLDTRLYADGLLVLRNGKIVHESYRHGLTAAQPRLLLSGTRPVLSLLGAIAVGQGKLVANRSIIRHIPALSDQAGLRKLSIQRLLDANSRFDWTAQELLDWQVSTGWKTGPVETGVRNWLRQPGRWDRDFAAGPPVPTDSNPDADLLAWALAETYRMPLMQVFCDQLFAHLRPEHAVHWLTDAQGSALSDGLALSLRDFARFGQMLVDAHRAGRRSRIPAWFIETLAASAAARKAGLPESLGLPQGSEARYGFVHLGKPSNRIALLGGHGNSLYIDFDRQLVIALYAAYPARLDAGQLAALNVAWDSLTTASQPEPIRQKP